MSQSLDCLLIHLVFSTKNRLPSLIDLDIRRELYAMMATSFQKQDSPARIIGGTADHVHALILLSRNQKLSKVVGEAKRITSLWLKGKGGRYNDFAWQAGYAAFSVSASLEDKVRQYIADQETHHAKKSLQDELRELLRKHGVEFDERYIWD